MQPTERVLRSQSGCVASLLLSPNWAFILIHIFISATVLLPTQTFIYKDIAEPCVWVLRFLKNILGEVQLPALSGRIETRGEYSWAAGEEGFVIA